MTAPADRRRAVRSGRRTLVVAVTGVAMLLAACSGDDDGSSVTAETVPPPTHASDGAAQGTTEPESAGAVDATGRDETAGSATAVTDASPTSDGAGTSSVAATTIPLSPSAEADLPEAAPGETVAPSTTTPGPLPVPDIDLLEVGELQRPTELTTRPRDDRAFVVEQAGRVIALDDLSTEPVLDISDRVQDRGNEQGLLGLAFHPTDDLAYVDYTGDDGDTVIAEFAVDPRTGVFDEGSERVVMTVDQPYSNHNGGQLVFGPDGLLYIGLGDGGAGGDPERRALDLSSRLGKILRIDPRQDGDEPFTVPADNPFVGRDGADPTVWSFGLRNPWRFSFDPVTGDLWIADVGQDQFEEVDHAPATDGVGAGRGLSFGWSAFEGNARYNEDQPAEGHVPPVVVYSHEDGNCSISGGVVARDSVVPDLDGWYLYGDYCSGRIWGYDTTRQADDPEVVELASLPTLATIAAGPAGDVYAVANDGRVMLVVPA